MSQPQPILLVYASMPETLGLLDLSKHQPIDTDLFKINDGIHVLISGIGIPETTFKLTQILSKHNYQFIYNIGLAGSFDSSLELGQIVVVQNDTFGDLGLATTNRFYTLSDLKLQKEEESKPLQEAFGMFAPNFELLKSFPKVSAVTVNSLLTNENQILLRKERFGAQIETMEGAAVFYVCKKMNLPVSQIRIISNQVGERDKTKWLLKPAILKLNSFVNQFLQINQE